MLGESAMSTRLRQKFNDEFKPETDRLIGERQVDRYGRSGAVPNRVDGSRTGAAPLRAIAASKAEPVRRRAFGEVHRAPVIARSFLESQAGALEKPLRPVVACPARPSAQNERH
jgi:hypothetical protein